MSIFFGVMAITVEMICKELEFIPLMKTELAVLS